MSNHTACVCWLRISYGIWPSSPNSKTTKVLQLTLFPVSVHLINGILFSEWIYIYIDLETITRDQKSGKRSRHSHSYRKKRKEKKTPQFFLFYFFNETSSTKNIIIIFHRYDMCRRRKGGRCTKGTAGNLLNFLAKNKI